MDINHIGIALAAYLTGGVTVYAYINRNRYIDLLLATIAIFIFGTSMLLTGLAILPAVAFALLRLSTYVMAFAVVFLLARIGAGIYRSIRKYLGLR